MKLIFVTLACTLAASCHAALVSPWACPLKNCVLKSPLATAGPGFQDGVRFFTSGSDGQDSREACPFGGDDGPEPTKKEYQRYMKGMDKVAQMPIEQRRAYALKHEDELNAAAAAKAAADAEPKEPSIDVTAPGVEVVTSSSWRDLRHANKFDFLVTFYAPWCPHCKAFVTSENAPIKALSESLEKRGGPKVVTFDITNSTPPISIDSVPTIYLFKRTGEAVLFEGNPHDAGSLMAFSLGKPLPKPALLAKEVVRHSHELATPSWACALKNCVLKSPLASAGPAFQDGMRFFAVESDGKDTRETCPFGPDDGKAPTKKEYKKYMKALDKVGDMDASSRRAWAEANHDTIVHAPEPKIEKPSVDIAATGVEAVNSKTWSQLRHANKFDMLVTFYAPWCPHCKRFVTSANAPLNALSESLEKVHGPKVVKYDMTESDPPIILDSVPTIYLYKTNGEASLYEGDPGNLEALMAFALDKPAEATQALVAKKVTQHLRKVAA